MTCPAEAASLRLYISTPTLRIQPPAGEDREAQGERSDLCKSGTAQALLAINSDFKAQLPGLNITAAKDEDAGGVGKLIFVVPVPQCVFPEDPSPAGTELEKKFSEKVVVHHSVSASANSKKPQKTEKASQEPHSGRHPRDPGGPDFPREKLGKSAGRALGGRRLAEFTTGQAPRDNAERKAETLSGVCKKQGCWF
ncbi:40S ribosomal protein S7-like [Molossus molossus]|uniref:40S ribosomal protein S7-like n=1 Tax=Molossus molossus TaxID=27622 RepID=UPI0017461EDD|nr:40S ribosomal protein S7-like [Molossus molossus]